MATAQGAVGDTSGDGSPSLEATNSQDFGTGPGLRVPVTIAVKGNPTADWTAAQRAVAGVLRNRPRGTTAPQIAAVAGLSERHVQRTLRDLAGQGFARFSEEKVPWGNNLLEVELWRLDLTEQCVRALAFLPRRLDQADNTCPQRVPPEFWPMFWSGTRGSDIHLPRDSFQVACTLLGCPDRAAQVWALQHLPIETLKLCRTMRGYYQGEIAAALDSAICEREQAHSG